MDKKKFIELAEKKLEEHKKEKNSIPIQQEALQGQLAYLQLKYETLNEYIFDIENAIYNIKNENEQITQNGCIILNKIAFDSMSKKEKKQKNILFSPSIKVFCPSEIKDDIQWLNYDIKTDKSVVSTNGLNGNTKLLTSNEVKHAISEYKGIKEKIFLP